FSPPAIAVWARSRRSSTCKRITRHNIVAYGTRWRARPCAYRPVAFMKRSATASLCIMCTPGPWKATWSGSRAGSSQTATARARTSWRPSLA
ncbi:unnamed protein product, partial [Symbiodinium sp. CCMP2456]